MPARRDRDDAIADELERVADALRAGEATVYGYRVRRTPEPHESGGVAYPGGWFEFRVEREEVGGDPDESETSSDAGERTQE